MNSLDPTYLDLLFQFTHLNINKLEPFKSTLSLLHVVEFSYYKVILIEYYMLIAFHNLFVVFNYEYRSVLKLVLNCFILLE